MVSDNTSLEPGDMGKLGFIVEFIIGLGFTLNLITILFFMAVFFIAKGFAQFATSFYRVNVQEWFIEKLRLKNIKGLNELKYKYFVMADVGRIQNTLTGEVDRVANSYNNYFKAFEFGILVVVYMIFAFFMNAQFAILVSIGGILTNALYTTLYKKTKNASREVTSQSNIFQRLIIQNVSNYKYLKATGSISKYQNKLENSVAKIKRSNKRIGFLDALVNSSREPVLITVVVLVIYVQTTFLNSDLGPILISLLFFYRALSYLMQMQLRYNMFLGLSGSLENISLFEQELKENKEDKGKERLRQEIRSLHLNNVDFKYDDKKILKKISLQIFSKETVAFVGESGSGKSTLVNIISGLLPLDGGIFTINDIPVKDLNLQNYQEKIGYITQDPVIFNDSLFNNVTFWAPKTEENINRFWKAVKLAAIFEFIEEQQDKEETLLGSNGVNLSGGQKQRISIARELYKEVEILILDEATSALDSETEKMIQNNIEALKGKYTILIVAHRISTIKNADRIVVMKNGVICNVNSFHNLIEESTYFKKLVKLQEI